MPSISIITAVYNGAATIADCLESVNVQTVPVEHIIIDGGSTDRTLDIVRAAAGPSSKIVSEPDNGIYDAMNKGIRHATGDIVGILNADDFYAETDVLAKVAAIFADPMVEACYGDLVYVKESGEGRRAKGERDKQLSVACHRSRIQIVRYWKSGEFKPDKFYWGWMPPHPTFFVRKSVYERYGAFNPDLGSAADYELMLRFLLKHRVNVAYISEVLVHMRTGGVSNASLKNRLRANQMDRLAWEVNGLRPYPWTLLMKPLRKLEQWIRRERENKITR